MIIRCIDFETTGIPSPTTPQAIVEAGWCDFDAQRDGGTIGEPRNMIVNPGRPIPPEASAVHHIVDRDVAGAPPQASALAALSDGVTFWAAHVADFESEFFGGKPLVCTFKAALRVWPDAPGHKLQELRYWLRLDDREDFDPLFAMPPHRAAPDAYVCAFVLRELLGHVSLGDIERWSRGRALLVTCFFKKYRGVRWSDVPHDYLEWVIENIKDDPDVRATARFYLNGGFKSRATTETKDETQGPSSGDATRGQSEEARRPSDGDQVRKADRTSDPY